MPKRRPTLLVIDDSRPVRSALKGLLEREGYEVLEAGTGDQGLRKALRHRPGLVLTDWVLGGALSGVAVCSRLKARPETRATPVVVMTGAKVAFEDELKALSHGADLYLNKGEILSPAPRSRRLLGYLRSLLARRERLTALPDRREGRAALTVDIPRHLVRTPYGTVSDLSTTLFELLVTLARSSPRTASRRLLLRSLWDDKVRDGTLDTAVSRLKGRLERRRDEFIECVFGRGYRLKGPASIVVGPAAGKAAVRGLT